MLAGPPAADDAVRARPQVDVDVGPLKAMVRGFLASSGVPEDEIERLIEGNRKEAPRPSWPAARRAGLCRRWAPNGAGT